MLRTQPLVTVPVTIKVSIRDCINWLANDVPEVLNVAAPATGDSSFQIVQDGHTLLAITDPHGTWLRWLP